MVSVFDDQMRGYVAPLNMMYNSSSRAKFPDPRETAADIVDADACHP